MFLKPSQETSNKYTTLLQNLFNKTVKNAGDYEMVYVYDNVTKNYIIFTKNITTNYLLGFKPGQDQFVIFQFADENENDNFTAGQAEYFGRNDIAGFKKNMFGKHVLELKNGKKYKFIIAPFTANIPGAYTVPVLQETQALRLQEALKV